MSHKDVASNIAHATETARERVGDAMDRAGTRISDGADRVNEEMSKLTNRAASALASGREYVRTSDRGTVVTDATRVLKRHPGKAMLAAAVIGFVVARTLQRSER